MLTELATKRIEKARFLDEPAGRLHQVVRQLVGRQPVKDALSGAWLGHRLHPTLVPVPIGAWTGALVLDTIRRPDARFGADVLVGLGIAAALPTAAAGLSDWSETDGEARRVGLVHAVANSTALTMYTGSLLARLLGARKPAVLLSWLGAGAVLIGGYLGGHLSYKLGVGVEPAAMGRIREEPPASATADAAPPPAYT